VDDNTEIFKNYQIPQTDDFHFAFFLVADNELLVI
jgi:hypothetical protein